jgi:hypothetical protein
MSKTQNAFVSAETQLVWDRVAQTCNNPLGLTEEIVQESLEVCPPIEYQGSTHIGRYLIPRSFVRYDIVDQPRDKGNEPDHVNDLVNNFETIGYRVDSYPPIASFDDADSSASKLKASSGFNRGEALDRIGQDLYVFDLYKFESKYWEIVARNQSNHHSNPQLSQKWTDYQKEVCNAVDAGVIPSTSVEIDRFVDLIAADKTAKVRRRIKDSCYNTCQVFPNFRTYNSSGHGKNTLNGFVKNNGFAKQGVEGRSDEELKAQGYIVYCAGNGDNKSTWMRAIYHGTRLGLPIWIFGYASNRVDDLQEFREEYIEEFNELKSVLLQFAFNTVEDGEISSIDEDSFPVKLAGFLPQYVKPNPEDKGRPTEKGLVDMYGNEIKFDPDGDCLTLSQP